MMRDLTDITVPGPEPRDDGTIPDAPASNLDLSKLRNIRFHQLVTLIETLRGEGPRVGSLDAPADEAIRFRATRSLSFGPADISAVSYDEAAEEFEVRVNFFGLYGPASPLPPNYTERIIEDDQTPSAVEDLLDLFNHRLIGLLHLIWRKYRYYLRYEEGGGDALSKRVLALCGFPIEDRRSIVHIPRSGLLPHVALLSLYCSSAEVVASTLSNFFRIPFRIEQFVARTVAIDADSRLTLGVANNLLGEDAILGFEVEDDLGKFRICVGEAAFEALAPFLPGGDRHRQLVELLTMISREPLEWDIQFDFAPETIPAARLGDCRLGWSSWLDAQAPDALENPVRIAAIDEPGGTAKDPDADGAPFDIGDPFPNPVGPEAWTGTGFAGAVQ